MPHINSYQDYDSVAQQVRSDDELGEMLDSLANQFSDERGLTLGSFNPLDLDERTQQWIILLGKMVERTVEEES